MQQQQIIDVTNFKDILENLKFTPKGEIYTKKLTSTSLKVDFTARKFIYPEEIKIHEQQVCNFKAKENFVVFECVHRLLAKGYKPEHLELEPKWKVGHGKSGGRADILVRNNSKESLLIIECKTFGTEYSKELGKMKTNGGQLFSYLQQEQATRYLCLYTSFFCDKKIINYENAIIKIKDRQEDIEAYNQGDKSIKLYENASNNKELFNVWKETFNLYTHYNGIFEDDINAYSIELKPLKKKNLKPFDSANKVYNTFMEILRHNNISDNANAFNRLLSLLLCKLVDEAKTDDEVLDFQVKEGEDTPEIIQDRLQKLYAEGMKEYLNEEIVYFADETIEDIIKKYPKQTPIEKIEDIFKQIKYYSNNEFAIKEVHNKELFIQNARVLNEIIKMLQNYQIRYNKKQQFLGDFFENILNHGVKQSEGQFFTPVPVVQFIILSIGLDKITEQKIANNEAYFLPKILDYACGAGHFLTESIDELQKFIENVPETAEIDTKIKQKLEGYKQSTAWTKDYIFGIEKDYRLARTSQIACFLNGDGDANIIFGDGLEDHDRLKLKKQQFDVVIANPPYSIKAFKNYLNVNSDKFSLFEYLTESASEIETLFLERTAQVLVAGGRAGIILPSSILSNYKKNVAIPQARTLLLENFIITAIAQFGKETFRATGTNTVVLFLQKRSKDFKKDRKYIADDIFTNVTRKGELEHIKSDDLLNKYLAYREISYTDYQTLLQKQPNDAIQNSELWQEYKTANPKLNTNKLIKKILEVEQEKFYHFMLTLNDNHQNQQVVLVNAGEKEQATSFLGYTISTAKGKEGLEIRRDANNNIQNKMYDEKNHNNPQKANSYILNNFNCQPINNIDESLQEHLTVANLSDMLDFIPAEFTKAISLTSKKKIEIKTKWDLVKLGSVINTIINGSTPLKSKNSYWNSKDIPWITVADFTSFRVKETSQFVSKKAMEDNKIRIIPRRSVLISCTATIGKVCINEVELSSNQQINAIICNKDKVLTEYLAYYMFLNAFKLKYYSSNSGVTHINLDTLKSFKIPLPPKNIQQKIVDKCQAIDDEKQQAEQSINKAKLGIEKKIEDIYKRNFITKKLSEIATLNPTKGHLKDLNEGTTISFIEMSSISTEGFISKMVDKQYKEVKKGSYTYFANNDIIIAKITPCMENGKCALVKNLTNGIALGSTEFHVIRVNKDILNKYIFSLLNRDEIRKDAKNNMTGKSGHRRVPESYYTNLKIPIPPLETQKKLITKIEALEQKIQDAQAIIDNISAKKQLVLDSYL